MPLMTIADLNGFLIFIDPLRPELVEGRGLRQAQPTAHSPAHSNVPLYKNGLRGYWRENGVRLECHVGHMLDTWAR